MFFQKMLISLVKKIISKFLTKSQKLQKPEKFQEYRPKRIIKFDKVNQIYANTATKIERTQFSKKKQVFDRN